MGVRVPCRVGAHQHRELGQIGLRGAGLVDVARCEQAVEGGNRHAVRHFEVGIAHLRERLDRLIARLAGKCGFRPPPPAHCGSGHWQPVHPPASASPHPLRRRAASCARSSGSVRSVRKTASRASDAVSWSHSRTAARRCRCAICWPRRARGWPPAPSGRARCDLHDGRTQCRQRRSRRRRVGHSSRKRRSPHAVRGLDRHSAFIHLDCFKYSSKSWRLVDTDFASTRSASAQDTVGGAVFGDLTVRRATASSQTHRLVVWALSDRHCVCPPLGLLVGGFKRSTDDHGEE